jgi:hypothetical protein
VTAPAQQEQVAHDRDGAQPHHGAHQAGDDHERDADQRQHDRRNASNGLEGPRQIGDHIRQQFAHARL